MPQVLGLCRIVRLFLSGFEIGLLYIVVVKGKVQDIVVIAAVVSIRIIAERCSYALIEPWVTTFVRMFDIETGAFLENFLSVFIS